METNRPFFSVINCSSNFENVQQTWYFLAGKILYRNPERRAISLLKNLLYEDKKFLYAEIVFAANKYDIQIIVCTQILPKVKSYWRPFYQYLIVYFILHIFKQLRESYVFYIVQLRNYLHNCGKICKSGKTSES